MQNGDYKLFLDISFHLLFLIYSYDLEFFYHNLMSFTILSHIDIMFFKKKNLIKEFNLPSIIII